jgi:tight adherence protein B
MTRASRACTWSIGAGLALALALLGFATGGVASAAAAARPQLELTAVPGASFPTREFRVNSTAPLGAALSKLHVSENGTPVQGATVAPAGAAAAAGTVLLIDRSWSMNGAPFRAALAAARAFVAGRDPARRVAIVFFTGTPEVASPLSTDTGALDRALASAPRPGAGTHIFDAASTALSMLRSAGISDGSIIILSDGQDTGSKVSQATVADQAISQDVRVYTIGLEDHAFDGSTLQSLASATEGQYLTSSSQAVIGLYRRLSAELANEYILRYTSQAPIGSAVKVSVSAPGYRPAAASYTAQAPASPSVAKPKSFFQGQTAALLLCLTVALLIGVGAFALTRRRVEVGARVGEFVSPVSMSPGERERALVEMALGDSRDHGFERLPRWKLLATEMDVAGITLSPQQLLVVTVVLSLVVAWIGWFEVGGPLGLVAAPLVPVAADFLIRHLADRQRRLFDEQLPDNLSVVASAMRAGQTFVGALQAVVDTAPEPSKRELRRAVTDATLGVPLEEALDAVGARMKSYDFQHVALIATLQRETGGNTAEVVELVADTIRERLELKRMVRSLTAQGRLAGVILSGLPVALLLLVSVINPSYESTLYHSTLGIIMLVFAGLMTISGSFVIKKLIQIDL